MQQGHSYDGVSVKSMHALSAFICSAGNGSLHGQLEMHGPGTLLRNTTLGPDISPLSVLVEAIDANVLHIKIGSADRWEVPQGDLFINTGMGEVQDRCMIHTSSCLAVFTVSANVRRQIVHQKGVC